MSRSSPSLRTETNVAVELALTTRGTYANPPEELLIDAVFVEPDGRELRVPAFWAGGQNWRVRYASSQVGTHGFRVESSRADERELAALTGTVEITPYTGDNALLRHGPVRVAADKRHFEHADGTPFFWLGDTWWMGLCHRLEWPQDFQRLAADRKEKGFNVVQIVGGLYPDMPAFDPRGANEAGYPWEPDYARLRPEYFEAADRKLAHLVASGITPCLVGLWGYFMPWMGVAKIKTHWRNVIARYGAWPMVWCAAGEANLPWYLHPKFPFDDRGQVQGWTEILRYIRDTDPWRRPLTIHPTAIDKYTARNATDDAALLDFDLLQTPHALNEAVEPAIRTVRESYAAAPRMPIIDGEPCYEMLNGTIVTAWPRRMFWSCVLNGAAGHTYGANGIWQVNRSGRSHGASPHGGDYGTTPWDEAMNFAGSAQVALGKRLFERFEWARFRPHPEWASFAGDPWLAFDDAQWIWSSRDAVPADAPFYRRYFRRTFDAPVGRRVVRARLRLAGANHIEARVNGAMAGTGWNWVTGSQLDGLAGFVHAGSNVLTIWVEHRPATKEPAGFLAVLELRLDDGSVQRVATDATWRWSDAEADGWTKAEFEEGGWAKAETLWRHGEGPRGALSAPDATYFGPQAAGIPGAVRIVYAPLATAIVVHQLGAHAAWSARNFDPVTGAFGEAVSVRADASGELRFEPPADCDHDWVVVLEGAS
ncbi:DUF4038 domain-containing protein [Horticoccus luteus]|uniref:DUF4038 domain-containing protein n=1 Tax=Horticoccus luteus TaxID=2862869 RepID=A0A8F9XFT3_9BACT|nr:DUF4038 domain-containing protein [Horticoccus luteus]QYM78427.1 DUF4038 domain-containing protein [Horticoccus luteus]